MEVQYVESRRNNQYFTVNGKLWGMDVAGGLIDAEGFTLGPNCKRQHTEATRKVQQILKAYMTVCNEEGILTIAQHNVMTMTVAEARNILAENKVNEEPEVKQSWNLDYSDAERFIRENTTPTEFVETFAIFKRQGQVWFKSSAMKREVHVKECGNCSDYYKGVEA